MLQISILVPFLATALLVGLFHLVDDETPPLILAAWTLPCLIVLCLALRNHGLRCGPALLATALALAVTLPRPSSPGNLGEGIVRGEGRITGRRALPARDGELRWLLELEQARLEGGSSEIESIQLQLPPGCPPPPPGLKIGFEAWMRSGRRLRLKLSDPEFMTEQLDLRGRCSLALEAWRLRIASRLDSVLSPRTSEIVKPLILGRSVARSSDLDRDLRDAGASHLFAVSGLHLGLLVLLLQGLLSRRVSDGTRRFLILVGALIYALLTGAQAPALRAFSALLLLQLAEAKGRAFHAGWAWLVGGCAAICWEPGVVHEISFQLSMAALAGLIWLAAPLCRAPDAPLAHYLWRKRSPLTRWLRSSAGVGAAAMVATAPVSIGVFGSLSPVALLSGPLLLPLITILLVGGMATLVLPGLSPALECAAWLTTIALDALAQVPGGRVHPSTPGLATIAAHILALTVAGAGLARGRRWLALLPLISLALILSARREEEGLLMIDVGQGSATLLRSAGESLLVDAGSSSDQDAGATRIRRRLRRAGIDRIDLLVVSHLDADHWAALPSLAKDFEIGRLALSASLARDPRISDLRAGLPGVPVLWLERGQGLRVGGMSLRVLQPPGMVVGLSRNDASLVLLVEAEGKRILLPGDIEEQGTQALLREEKDCRDIDLLLLPHHGADNQELEALLQRCQAKRIAASARESFVAASSWALALRYCQELHITGRDGELFLSWKDL